MKRIFLPLLLTALAACQDLGPMDRAVDSNGFAARLDPGTAVRIAGFDFARGGDFSITRAGTNALLDEMHMKMTAADPDGAGLVVSYVPLNDLTGLQASDADIVLLFSRFADTPSHQAPIAPLSASEQSALVSFVEGGRCAILVSDFGPVDGSWDAANNSLIEPFGMAVAGMHAGFLNAPVVDNTTALTAAPGRLVGSVGTLSPGLLTDLGPATAIAAIGIAPAGPVMALIDAGVVGAGAGPVIAYTNALSFRDEEPSTGRGLFGQNANLWLNTIDYCMEWDDVVNTPPTADAGGPYAGTEGFPVDFAGSGTDSEDPTDLDFDWDFGDGATGTGQTPSHTYAAAGTYTVMLTVADPQGASATSTATATIAPASPADLVELLIGTVQGSSLDTQDVAELVFILEKALEKIQEGKNGADDKLVDFIDRVDKFEKKGLLGSEEAQGLIDAAQTIIDALNT